MRWVLLPAVKSGPSKASFTHLHAAHSSSEEGKPGSLARSLRCRQPHVHEGAGHRVGWLQQLCETMGVDAQDQGNAWQPLRREAWNALGRQHGVWRLCRCLAAIKELCRGSRLPRI